MLHFDGKVAIPGEFDLDAVDDLLHRKIESGEARRAATDGGQLVTETDEEGDEDSTDAEISGPHIGLDPDGNVEHRFWRCERCGLESTDETLTEGCWRCKSE